MFTLYADKDRLRILSKEQLISGSVNVYQIHFDFSSDWTDLEKIVVFRTGDNTKTINIPLIDDSDCVIPWEVLSNPNVYLYIGVYGYLGDELIRPSPWANLGVIIKGATLGEESTKPPATMPDNSEGGTLDHRQLRHRKDPEQHPISAISGLAEVLETIPSPVEPLTNEDLEELLV